MAGKLCFGEHYVIAECQQWLNERTDLSPLSQVEWGLGGGGGGGGCMGRDRSLCSRHGKGEVGCHSKRVEFCLGNNFLVTLPAEAH